MKKLDAATAKKIAPSALMVLVAGPVFLFMAMDLILFAAMSASRGATSPNQVVDLSMEIVICIMTGVLSAFGIRSILRALKD
ncbi:MULTISPECIES: hypothetical protein [unclassified Phenylobacterium]|uniref:hypothetical protein n=1 Tax=unclassified Phenylobacterium TaxID=2640670 RepID=UPI0022645C64|nr:MULTISPECIES: hypothetical protein [unclassified Phenylobacterium]MBS0491465.1 hypothetical protein [Pseudomonadota bacterium]MCX7585596.1 hypothetical protein [Phenylobacterium sp. 58.2.17]WGU39383.1 hypothetical protein O4N75_17290 [Phenylobacterium sp. NIBR 498073]